MNGPTLDYISSEVNNRFHASLRMEPTNDPQIEIVSPGRHPRRLCPRRFSQLVARSPAQPHRVGSANTVVPTVVTELPNRRSLEFGAAPFVLARGRRAN